MFQSIDDYIETFPAQVQERLQAVRQTIQAAAPGATEKISYGIPTFALGGNLVHFAAFKKHLGLYPGAEAVAVFAAEMAGYKRSKGTIQFPFERPLPLDLIGKIVLFRVARLAELSAQPGAADEARGRARPES